jgi:DNA-binding beta-propeller fold protein YncE
MRRAAVTLMALGTTLALLGCGAPEVPTTGPTPTPDPGTGAVARVVFVADSIAVTQGGSAQASAIAVDAAGQPVSGATVAYSVVGQGAGVATVSTGGAVSGVKPGVTGIRASVGSVAATATLEVFGHPEGLLVGSEPLDGRPFGAAVSRHGVVYVTRLDAAAVARLDTTRRVVQSIAVGATPTGIAFSPAGDLAYVTNQASRTLGIVDVAAGAQVATIPLPADPFVPFVSPDGAKLFVTSNTSRVFVADAQSRALTGHVELTHAPNGFALHPDGARVYVSASFGGTVHEIDIATNAVRRTFEPGGMPQGLSVSRDGRELFVANEAGWLDVYALGSGERVARVALAGGGFGLATSPDEQHLYVSLPNAGTVQVVNIEARRIIHTLTVHGTPRRIAFTRHGGVAVIPNEAGYVSFVR